MKIILKMRKKWNDLKNAPNWGFGALRTAFFYGRHPEVARLSE